ncbi:hypothetical protein JP75_14375 [Devosia riboflavina]|uniref:Uncharacterized protein n=1 Tax=Devosia riboflavina TaxID=46914 RepID=A0A087M1A2_9HYPH|nr:hypothetical protein [Devosia riboflavina]KFL30655.1 hypothetical protein JP75_14375 [Devosia riboflavina]
MMKDEAAHKRSPIIWVALTLTVLFLALFGALLLNTAMPSECPAGVWLLERLACLSPNELGDTFAGAFAPVAFVWLVTAVLLQRDELAAQRQELRQSREVAEQQFEESKRNVDYIRQQTELMIGEHEEAEARAEIKSLVSAIVDALQSFEAMAENMKVTHVFDTLSPFKKSSEPSIPRQLEGYIKQVIEFSEIVPDLNSDNGPVEYEEPAHLERFEADLQQLLRKTMKVGQQGAHDPLTPDFLGKGLAAVHYLRTKDDPPDYFFEKTEE